MTFQDIITACNNFTEQRIQLFAWQTWIDTELSLLIHRQRYWWRRKLFQLPILPNVQFYDLSAPPAGGGSALAPDLEQMINLYWFVAGTSPPESKPLKFIQNEDDVQIALNTGGATAGPPAEYFVNPGSTSQLGFSPVPDAGYPLSGLYWATYIIGSESGLTVQLPLLPGQFHHLVLLQTLKRACLYLYGQEDPRYATLKVELDGPEGELAKLDAFQSYSNEPQAIRPPWIGQPWKTKEELAALAHR